MRGSPRAVSVSRRAGVGVGSALRRGLAVAALLALTGCGDDTSTTGTAPLEIPEGCNPLYADGDCLLPFPSDLYRVEGDAGPEVRIPEAAWVSFDGKPTDLVAFHRPDGFSVGAPILALLPEPVDPEPLVFWTEDVNRSVDPDSPTVLVDATTGERVVHFAEVDPRAADTPARQALILRPLDRLTGGHRYVVGLRGLTDASGKTIDAPPGMKSLRDDKGARNQRLADLSAHYESDIFPVLEDAGVPRGEVQLAWDFTARSDDSVEGDMLAIRDDVTTKLDATPPAVEVVSVETDPNQFIARRIEITVEVPLYVDSPEPGARLVYGADGKPTATSTVKVPATVWVPKSVANRAPGDPPARLLQYGHGFFGDRTEADDFPSQLADEEGFVIVAADWWGMSSPDRSIVIGDLAGDPGNILRFTDRVHQGMANFLALAKAAKGPIANLPELDVGGAPAYDPSTIYFYGISMGHILGGTYVALSPDVHRAVLEVGGADWSLMMFRARPFSLFLAVVETLNQDKLDQQKFAALIQTAFDRIDPLSYAPHILKEPLPGGPTDRKVLMHVGVGDSEVPNLATYFHARNIGVPVLEEASPFVPLGLDSVAPPTDGSALTIFDFGYEPETQAVAAAMGNEVHEGVRKTTASKKQVSAFLRADGVIDNPCSGVCDPE
ncbi:MAG TPA: hypothetical protein VL400_18555 [Polyangiaceae bacterium]|nr:hypothetical protein [Polyangiaceae bacterium]